jgi:hypothetical protein
MTYNLEQYENNSDSDHLFSNAIRIATAAKGLLLPPW